jgi:endonuclease III
MVTAIDERQTNSIFAREVLRRLETSYGRPSWQVEHSPLDELVLTILSQHTSDINCERAFASLRATFPTWDELIAAPDEAIADAIRAGGLARVKAPRIKMVVSQVLAGNLLDGIEKRPLAEAKALLRSLPGVGPKTAACVLLFACRRPALPVDTHVYRVSQRVGLIDGSTNPEDAHETLEALLDAHDVYSFHINMIQHGRAICRARSPQCASCPLADLCRHPVNA